MKLHSIIHTHKSLVSTPHTPTHLSPKFKMYVQKLHMLSSLLKVSLSAWSFILSKHHQTPGNLKMKCYRRHPLSSQLRCPLASIPITSLAEFPPPSRCLSSTLVQSLTSLNWTIAIIIFISLLHSLNPRHPNLCYEIILMEGHI